MSLVLALAFLVSVFLGALHLATEHHHDDSSMVTAADHDKDGHEGRDDHDDHDDHDDDEHDRHAPHDGRDHIVEAVHVDGGPAHELAPLSPTTAVVELPIEIQIGYSSDSTPRRNRDPGALTPSTPRAPPLG